MDAAGGDPVRPPGHPTTKPPMLFVHGKLDRPRPDGLATLTDRL
jgi:hypothetical protein